MPHPETGHRPKARAVNMKTSRYDIKCGRPGPWGNPYRIGPDGDRNEVIAKHKAHLQRRIESGDLKMEQLAALSGKRLGCWCKPRPCHADHLARLADAARAILDTLAQFRQRGAEPQAMAQARTLSRRILAADKGSIQLTGNGCLEFQDDEVSEPVTVAPDHNPKHQSPESRPAR